VNRKQRRQQKKLGQPLRGGSRRFSAPPASSGGVSAALLGNAGVPIAKPAGVVPNDVIGLALKQHRSGHLDHAEKLYRQVLAQSPDHPRCLHLLGLIAHQKGNSEHAVELIGRSVLADPSDAEAHNNMGNALRRLGRVDEAIASYEKAIERAADFAGAYSNLGLTLRQQGDFGGAAKQFREALKRAPDLAEAWSGLARTGRMTFHGEEPGQAEAVLATGKLSHSDQRHLHYALGKHYDDAGEWDRAFPHFKAANDLRETAAITEGPVRLMASMVSEFGDPGAATLPKIEPKPGDPVPVFIFGMPRSGTTLVEQILASHPWVDGGGETNSVEAAISRLAPKLLDGKGPKISDLTEDALGDLRRSFLECFPSREASIFYVTDKSPFNFIYFPLIAAAFPEARFVHCRRDPLDTCLSIYFTDFKQGRAFTTDLEAIGTFYREYQNTVTFWEGAFPGRINRFEYEAVVNDQEAETRRLLDACDLPWDDACLNFFDTKRQVSTPSDWQVRLPIFSSSRGRWRHYQDFLAPLIKTLES